MEDRLQLLCGVETRRNLEGGTDREISASFEQEKSATEVGQPTPVG